MNSSQLFACLLLASVVAGCSDKAAPAAVPPSPAAARGVVAPAASKETLMQAVFGKDYRPATKDALAQLPMFEDRKKIRLFVVAPLASTVLATGETVLVAQSTYAEELNAEKIEQPDYSNVYLAVYLLRENAGKWTVVKRHPNIAYRGFDERRGTVLFPMLGKGIAGLATASGTNDEGCFTNAIHLFNLRDDPLRDLTGSGIPTGSSTNIGCGGTELQPDKETNATWYLAPSKKSSAYSDIVVNFITKTTIMSGPGENAKKTIVTKKDSARYAFDGKHYKVIAGDSPIDGLAPDGKPYVNEEPSD